MGRITTKNKDVIRYVHLRVEITCDFWKESLYLGVISVSDVDRLRGYEVVVKEEIGCNFWNERKDKTAENIGSC